MSRLDAFRARLEGEPFDALLVSNSSNRRYLSGFSGSSGFLLIDRDEAVLATDFRYYEQAEAQAPEFRLFKAAGPLEGWMGEFLSAAGGRKLGFEATDVSYALYRQLAGIVDELPAARRPQLVPSASLIESLRAKKDAAELAKLQVAIDLGDAAIAHAIDTIEAAGTEKQVAWEIERYIHEHGGEGTSFSSIVAGGAWGAMPHAYPRDYAFQSGDGIVIDMGAKVDGYCSDLTRTVTLGPTVPRFREIYDIVLAAQLAAYEMIEPGMTGEQAHMLAKSVIEAAGYGECFGPRTRAWNRTPGP